jgi:signal transduction histidine kinase
MNLIQSGDNRLNMKTKGLRWISVGLGSLVLTGSVLFLDLPFETNLFRFLLRIQGPVPPSAQVCLVTLDLPKDQWIDLLDSLLRRLEAAPPKAVQLDFDLQDSEKARIGNHPFPFPLFTELHDSPGASESLLPIVSSPEYIHPVTHKLTSDPFMDRIVNLNLIQAIAPARLDKTQRGAPQLFRVAGPPGTFPSVKASDILASEEMAKKLEDKIVLLSASGRQGHTRLGEIPFFPKGGARGFDETEIHANAIDTILFGGIRVTPAWLTVTTTFLVSTFTMAVLFGTSPLVALLSLFLMTGVLFLSAMAALHSRYYLDIHGSIFAILAGYYFLIPYRLIKEYESRWGLEQKNKLMAEVEVLKDNFMSLVSHNLKTPIARITGAVENLLGRKDLGLQDRRELESVLHSADDLNRLVSRILTLAQVERPEYQIKTASKDLNVIVEKVVETHRRAAEEKRIRLTRHLEPLFPVLMDAELIRESVSNLVENAIKYTPSGGQVEVRTAENSGWLKVSVADDGPGISSEEMEKIFSKFYRGNEVKNKGIRGSGLGLYLVKYFVELHGGMVECRNRSEGGSEFWIQLLRK